MSSLPRTGPPKTSTGRLAFDPLSAFTTLIEQAHTTPPAELYRPVRTGAAYLGAREVRLLLVDFGQQELRPVSTPGAREPAVRVDDLTAAGQAYLLGVPVVVDHPNGGAVIACPLLDGIERLGVLELTVDDGDEATQSFCRRYTEIVTQFVATKGRYTDEIHLLREAQPMSLSAQLQWQLLPPITAHIPALTVAAQLLPEILSQIDQEISRQFPDERFVAALPAELDYATGSVRLVNAGAPQPVLLRDHRIIPMPHVDPVPPLGLGLGLGLPPECIQLTLQPGDRLLLVTDGILDARNAQGEQFGEAGLVRLAERTGRQGLPLAEIARAITRGVADYQDGQLHEDASLLIISYTGLPGAHPPASMAPPT